MSKGMRVAKQGYSATDPTTPKHKLAFSSEYISPKIYKTVRFTSTGNFTHNLTYPPMFFISCQIPNDYELTVAGETIEIFSGVDEPWMCMTNSILQSTVLAEVYADEEKIYCSDMGISDVVIVHLLKDAINE